MVYRNEDEDLVFLGAGMSSTEMDTEFKKLYDSLLLYKNNIFHLVDTICNDCDTGERLALNIAERDSVLLQRLVARECEQRRMTRKAEKGSSVDQIRAQEKSKIDELLRTRSNVMGSELLRKEK